MHGMPPRLPEGVRSLDNRIKDPAFHSDLVAFEVQGDTVFPHEHGAKDDIVSVDVDDIKVMVILRFANFEVGKPKFIFEQLPTVPSCRGMGSSNLCAFKFADVANSGETESDMQPESRRANASRL